jgi:hypothetical protein
MVNNRGKCMTDLFVRENTRHAPLRRTWIVHPFASLVASAREAIQ